MKIETQEDGASAMPLETWREFSCGFTRSSWEIKIEKQRCVRNGIIRTLDRNPQRTVQSNLTISSKRKRCWT